MKAFAKSSMIGNIVSKNQSIFISHSSADSDSALLIHKQLKGRGFNPWLAVTDVPPGANYARTIMEALESATALVLILTESAIKSEHVAREVEVAVSQKIPIFPLNMSGQKDVQPLLTKEWRYWLAIVQVLNAADPTAAVTSVIEAFKRNGLEISDKAITTNSKNQPSQNKLQIPAALQANRIRNDQAERVKRELDAKVAQERLAQEARERDRIIKEKEKNEQEERERKKKAENEAKLALEREERERKEKEDREQAERQSRLELASPRIEQANRVIDWLDELSDWLYSTAWSGSVTEDIFDYLNFKSTFDENFIVDLDGLEDIAEKEIYWIGENTLDIYKIFIECPHLTQGNPELAKPFLDLSLKYKSPWSLFYAGEWSFARNGVEAGKKHFLNPEHQATFLERARRKAKYETGEDELEKEVSYKFHVFEWKWMELLVQLADRKIRPDRLNSIFQEIDKTLTKDSADERAEVYLDPRQRIQWKFLGSYALYRLERNTAARNFLRGFNVDSDEYIAAKREILFTKEIAIDEASDFVNDLLKVIDSWR